MEQGKTEFLVIGVVCGVAATLLLLNHTPLFDGVKSLTKENVITITLALIAPLVSVWFYFFKRKVEEGEHNKKIVRSIKHAIVVNYNAIVVPFIQIAEDTITENEIIVTRMYVGSSINKEISIFSTAGALDIKILNVIYDIQSNFEYTQFIIGEYNNTLNILSKDRSLQRSESYMEIVKILLQCTKNIVSLTNNIKERWFSYTK